MLAPFFFHCFSVGKAWLSTRVHVYILFCKRKMVYNDNKMYTLSHGSCLLSELGFGACVTESQNIQDK